jgi:glycosyltransferase involved in cell wall biosynthesis
VASGTNVAVIATVLNEAAMIDELMRSLLAGRRLPDEIVIVDAGSDDGTQQILLRWAEQVPQLTVLTRAGCGRSEGRNVAIATATASWLAVTDGGVRLASCWLEALLVPVEQPDKTPPDVVAGFFRAAPRTRFERALGAVTLPARREIRPESFLPSSRSVLFSRQAWAAAGGYPVWLDYGEDLVFDLALRRAGARIAWAPRALAHFRPRSNVKAFFRQYYCYARGDGKALLWPRRHAIRYGSYAALLLLLLAAVHPATGRLRWPALAAIVAGAAVYLRVPYHRLLDPEVAAPPATTRRVDWQALAWLPVLRVVGDLAKMLGYPAGRLWRWRRRGDVPRDPTAPHHALRPTTGAATPASAA